MKKFLYLLFALPFMTLTSCQNDEYPDVTINIEFEGAQEINNVLYVVAGEPFAISEISVTPVQEGKTAGITYVNYSFDGWFIGRSIESPFTIEFDASETSEMSIGEHILGLEMMIAEVGCAPATGYYNINLVVVESAEDIPTVDDSTQTSMISVKPAIEK